MIDEALELHKGKFTPKYRAFNILKKNIEDVVTKSKAIWRSIYKLPIPAIIEKGAQEMKNPKKNEQKEKETAKDVSVKDGHVEGTEEIVGEDAIAKDE